MKKKGKNTVSFSFPSTARYFKLRFLAFWCKFISSAILFPFLLLTILVISYLLYLFSGGSTPIEQTIAQIVSLIFYQNPSIFLAIFLLFVPFLLIGLLGFVFFRILAEIILLRLDITINTYRSAIAVEKLLRSQE